MTHIFFYRYEDGTEGFGFYDHKEALERIEEFKDQVTHLGSRVEFGIACIESSECLNCD